MHITKKIKLYAHLLIPILFYATVGDAAEPVKRIITSNVKEYIGNFSRQFLDITKWNDKYDAERKRDAVAILDKIDGPLLVNLSDGQKKQVVEWMRMMLVNQLSKDREFFKNFLLTQFNKFFTIDELQTLIAYYKTDLMQMVIQASIEYKEVTVNDINKILEVMSAGDKQIIESFGSSYLSRRYDRFQESNNPEVSKIIYERTKEILYLIMKRVPELIKYAESNQTSSSLDLNIPQK